MNHRAVRRNWRRLLFFSIGTLGGALICEPAFALTKREAFDMLSRQGPKWRLTESLPIEAESKVREARAKTRPLLQLGLSQYVARINPIQFGVDQQPRDTVAFGSTALEMRWTILDPVANFESTSAEAQLDISKAQARQYQTDLTAAMLMQYLTVQKLKSQLATLGVSEKRSAQLLKLAREKSKVGAGIPLDVARARSLSDLDRIKKLQLQTKLSKAANELAVLLGTDAPQADVEPLKFVPAPAADLRSRLAEAPERRADVQTAHAGVLAARKLNERVSRRFFPKLNILGDIGTTEPTWFGMPPERATGFVGVKLEIPLETGGLLDAKRQSAVALGMRAEAQETQIKLEIQNQMREAMEQIEAANEAAHVAGQYVRSTEEEAALVDRRFALGGGSVLDVVNSHNNVATAKDTEIDAIFTYEAAQVALYRTIGSFDAYFK